MLKDNINIVTIPAYRVIGQKWEGPYSEVPKLKNVIASVSERVGELEYAVNPKLQLGLSYNLRQDGFVHYSGYEVTDDQPIPEGMLEFQVPEMTYLITEHEKGQNIGQSYEEIYQWIKENGYVPFQEKDEEYYDKLPIKHERYPADRDLDDPHFDILIPISKQNQ
ncbi:GyrI-like domain-containing protein [Pontibacillus marinus]|uniref:Transcription activator effector binding protein n=1 Tax=Pontibacillus marinus BH030004 = DSM 16465 TaxID=1385511 RepID=A0A0A5I2W1_9BACI|nr:GyrI-like domain-containing protein [Pontibacillus marinus]KGX90182.1 transcription activator effector binding protein [Pontibacillus marinus BH030004 = DSM 16465]